VGWAKLARNKCSQYVNQLRLSVRVRPHVDDGRGESLRGNMERAEMRDWGSGVGDGGWRQWDDFDGI